MNSCYQGMQGKQIGSLWIHRYDVWPGVANFICAPVRICFHYYDVIMCAIASQITSLTIFYSIIYSDADQRKHQSSASLAFVRGSHRVPVNSPHKWQVTRKMFPFDDVIMSRPELGSNGIINHQDDIRVSSLRQCKHYFLSYTTYWGAFQKHLWALKSKSS